MKILKTYIREGLFERSVLWDTDVNLIFSKKNTCGKTTLLRALLYSLGYPIPNTKKIKFEKCIIITEILKGNVCISIKREGEYLQVLYADKEEQYFLPHDQNEFHKKLWGTENLDLLANILGTIYIDQEKGWTLLNRGKVIGNIRYNIEQLLRGLTGKDCSDLVFKERQLSTELKKYRQMLSVSKYKEEINEFKDELFVESYDDELRKELELLTYELSAHNKELKRVDSVIKKNESFRKYIENMKIRVRASNGEEVPVNKDTIIDMNEYSDMLQAKRRMIVSDIARLNNKIDRVKLELPVQDDQLSFVESDSLLHEFDKNMMKFNIDAISVNGIIAKIEKEHKAVKEAISEATKKDNHVVDNMYKLVLKYSKELNLEMDEKTTYLFTSNLKELSGAVLHKLVFVYRLAGILEVEKVLGYKLPIIIDSPSGKEVDRGNVEAMMKILARDFKDNQIIVASIYEYDFQKVNRIILEERLVDQTVKEF